MTLRRSVVLSLPLAIISSGLLVSQAHATPERAVQFQRCSDFAARITSGSTDSIQNMRVANVSCKAGRSTVRTVYRTAAKQKKITRNGFTIRIGSWTCHERPTSEVFNLRGSCSSKSGQQIRWIYHVHAG